MDEPNLKNSTGFCANCGWVWSKCICGKGLTAKSNSIDEYKQSTQIVKDAFATTDSSDSVSLTREQVMSICFSWAELTKQSKRGVVNTTQFNRWVETPEWR